MSPVCVTLPVTRSTSSATQTWTWRWSREGPAGLAVGAQARHGAHRVRDLAGHRDEARPARVHVGRRASAARRRLASRAHPARRHLRIRPLARRGPCIAVLRGLGVVPVRPRPRGCRRARRRHPRDPRTRARPRGPRLRSPVRGCRPWRWRRLRTSRDRPLGARHPDWVLLLDRWRLGPRVRRPRVATPPHR